MRRRTVAALVASATIVVGIGVADALDAVPFPALLTLEPAWEQPAPLPTPTLDPVPTVPPVLPALAGGTDLPDAGRLAELTGPLVADPATGSSVGVVVLDATTGEALLEVDASAPRVPASTLKLLTAAAALDALDETARLRTRVLAGPDVATDAAASGTAAGTIYLVGGGDVLLAAGAGDDDAVVGRAGLADLAAATAAALTDRGVDRVRLVLDDGLFTGPATAPGWGPVDLGGGFVMPVAALAVDRGMVPGRVVRDTDAARTAAGTFAAALGQAGLAVEGDLTRGAAPEGARELAGVESATVGELVALALRESDNDVAEVLARLVAVEAGGPGDFETAAAAVLERLTATGLDVSNATIVDGSGLSEGNRVPTRLLADVVVAVADPARPHLVRVATGMPVAGLEGTLADRFVAPEDPAAGTTRAKTGTLLTVVGLAGTVLDADGRLLAFAVVADGIAVGGAGAARDAIDAWVSDLATCGCAA